MRLYRKSQACHGHVEIRHVVQAALGHDHVEGIGALEGLDGHRLHAGESRDAAGVALASMEIERVGPDDWERVRAVRLRALVDTPDAFWETVEQARARPPASWREQLAESEAATFLAYHDSRDVGLAGGAPQHYNRAEAGLYAVWVDPQVRGEGIGTALVNAVVEWARAAGYRCLRLYVGDENPTAVRLYARLGFEATGATVNVPAPREHIQEHERILQL